MSGIDRSNLAALRAREEAAFAEAHPRSRELFETAGEHLLAACR